VSAELLVGATGLLGAIVGAGAAFAGVVYQQRRQAELARMERRDAVASQAVDTIVAELERVRQVAREIPLNIAANQAAAQVDFRDHLDAIQLASLRLPDLELREALEAACFVGFGLEESFREEVDLDIPAVLINAMAWDAQKCLGAYLRQEARPETTFLFRARDYYHSMVDRSSIRSAGSSAPPA
jgi:hypothetical protein